MGSKLFKNWISFNLRGNLSNASPEGCLKIFLLEFFKSALEKNYSNPFNPITTFKYSIPELSKVKLTFFNLLGEEVAILVNEEKVAGYYTVEFNVTSLAGSVSAKGGYASGVYFYQLKAGEFVQTKKMVLMK